MIDHNSSDVAYSQKVLSRSYTFDPRPYIPFRLSVKRYWTWSNLEPSLDNGKARGDALTLMFTHGTGFHKEHWETVIHRLFEHQRITGGRGFQIQDVWAIDAPNHGDSSVLNEDVFAEGHDAFSWDDFARCIHALVAGLGTGIDVDFSKRNLVAIGHSMGANALITSMTYSPQIAFSSIHLIEPGAAAEVEKGRNIPHALAVENRRDIWETKEEAYNSLKGRRTWKHWDDRILRLYVEHGLRSLPTAEYPEQKQGVTLKCMKKQEATVFRLDRLNNVTYQLLPHIVAKIPTHITYGEISDLFSDESKHGVLYDSLGNRREFSSVTFVPGAGHLVLQTHPDTVADIIWKSLTKPRGRVQPIYSAARARL